MKNLLLLFKLYFTYRPLALAVASLVRSMLASISEDSAQGRFISKPERIALTDKFWAVYDAANNKERLKAKQP